MDATTILWLSLLAGIAAAGLVWFGWGVVDNLRGRKGGTTAGASALGGEDLLGPLDKP